MSTFYPINSPLINYFFYGAPLTQDGPNIPLAGGFIFFYADEDHNVQLPTYSNIFDPDNPVVNTNPIELGAAGECDLFYLENRLYYIVITDSTGDQQNPLKTISHYDPAGIPQPLPNINNNFITNGQFAYPIEFWQEDEEEGLITQERTAVAWGWEFVQDKTTTTKNLVTFQSISNSEIEGNPLNQIVLTSTGATNETRKDFTNKIGSVDFMQGGQITFAAQMINLLSGTAFVDLFIELNYGIGGSETQILELTTFTVGVVRDKQVFTFDAPDITGKTLGTGNFLSIIVRGTIGQTTTFGFTNALGVPDSVEDPIYYQESYADTIGQILGSATKIDTAGLAENFSNYMYTAGKILPIPRTGEITLYTIEKNPPWAVICDSSSYNVSGYDEATKIPLRRLWNEIHDTYGGSGDLIVTATTNVVTFESDVGGRPLTAFSAQTAPVTIANTVIGCALGFTAVRSASNTVDIEWLDNFAPNQTSTAPGLYSNVNGLMTWNAIDISNATIICATIAAGSGVTQAQAVLTFNSEFIPDYETNVGGGNTSLTRGIQGFLDFADKTNNTRGSFNYTSSGVQANVIDGIAFSVDGSTIDPLFNPAVSRVTVPFSSTKNLAQNIEIFCLTAANPFQTTVTVNSLPANNSHFFYSSITTDYYGWFNSGGGVDPGPYGGRTSVEIPINTGMTNSQIATAIAAATDNLVFSVPGPGDLPDLQGGSLVENYIFL